MTTKFITLTNHSGKPLLINPLLVSAIESDLSTPTKTRIYVMGNQSWFVNETPDEIMDKIKMTDPMTIIQYDPKKP